MTVSIAPMPFPAREPTFRTVAVASNPQTCSTDTDGNAQRISAAVTRGDEVAFRELYDAYHDRLFRLAVMVGQGDEAQAHEIVQAVMLTAAAKLKPVQTEEHLWNWLARVARQNLSKAWRQQQREAMLINVGELPETVSAVEADDVLEERLDAALMALPADDRRVVEWFYFDRLSQKEIAERTQTTAKAVSSRLERVRARLRSLLTGKLSHET